eukprot:CAMPEP_0184482380 /NCGR_PEP_ID=MMETSP0113_2-20130426/3945_1 /TAXON_ID=91329 /ORGANISM="Norrisiella sphaerica, Strain BC52" /LENGTH=527 /DNA_ID=CAMNT_0026862075 /DNA_START=29 /DNA_END=1609 /DNA_ORIENTATION=+
MGHSHTSGMDSSSSTSKPKKHKKAKHHLWMHKAKRDDKKKLETKSYPPNWVLGDEKFLRELGHVGKKSEYKIVRRIGQPGAFGEAFVATHGKFGKVAVKDIHKSKFCSSARHTKYYFEAFRNEIIIMSKMHHPNIIKYYDVFEDADNLCIVMELCEGGELYDRLIEHSHGYSEKQAARILRQLFDAVAYMHRNEFVHCDLKPDNFLFKNKSEESSIKIIDFGMAKHVQPNEYYHRQCGTYYYKAPEILFEAGYNTPADMWSMGVIMFAVLYGTLPFRSRNRDPKKKVQEVEDMIVKGFSPVLRKGEGPWFDSDARVSESARNLIAELLQRNPEKRMTADEVLKHSWFANAPDEKLSPLVIQSLKEFHHHNKLKDIVLKNMCTKIVSKQEQVELREAFNEMDIKKDGHVTLENLKKVLHKCNVHDDHVIEQWFNQIDVDHSGEINYQELLMAYADMKISTRQERLYRAFHHMQKHEPNKDRITVDDILDIVKSLKGHDKISEKEIKTLFKVYAEKDGTIDYKGFAKMW